MVSPQFHVSFNPSFQTVKRTYEGLPLEIKWLQAVGLKASAPKTHSSTQRERRSNAPPAPAPLPPPDVQFHSPDPGPQDLTPVLEDVNLQGPSPSEGAQGWFDVEEAPHPSGADKSDGKASAHSMATLRRPNRQRCHIERLAYATLMFCTCAAATLPNGKLPMRSFPCLLYARTM